jgi:hypothetical protein
MWMACFEPSRWKVEEWKGVYVDGVPERLVMSENLVDDIELEGEIAVIAAKLLEVEKFYLSQGYSDIKMEMQFPACDAIHYSVFGNRLETDREYHSRLREAKRKSEMKSRKEGDQQFLDTMILDLLKQKLGIADR